MPRALVVDDNDEIRDLVALFLTDLGLSPVMASNGKTGLLALEEVGPFDVAIVDLYMPEMDGIEFIRAVRTRPGLSRLKILVATNAGMRNDVQGALSAGADEYLMKPYSPDMLREKLRLLRILPE